MGRPFSLSQNCLSPWGIWTHLTHGSLSPPDSTPQTASWSVQPFFQGSQSRQTDRLTETEHGTPSVTRGCTAMWPNNSGKELLSVAKICLTKSFASYTIEANINHEKCQQTVKLRNNTHFNVWANPTCYMITWKSDIKLKKKMIWYKMYVFFQII